MPEGQQRQRRRRPARPTEQFQPLSGVLLAGCHDSGVVDVQVQRRVPRAGEGRDGTLIGEVEPGHGNVGIAGCGRDAGRGALASGQVADGERDGGGAAGELAGGLGSDARRPASHDRAAAAEISALGDVGGGN
jgi:hypothetical protein